MCGVFGYIGARDAVDMCFRGLELLEYRGYDSTGIAGIGSGKISFCKRAGKLSALKEIFNLPVLQSAIAHTRWATHGAVNDQNAHPHLDMAESLAIIHNGIIENYAPLKESLQKEGVFFHSDTDTEVIAQLIAKHYSGNVTEALYKTLALLEGNFSLVLIHKDHPNEIFAAAHGCPLAIAIDEKKTEAIISSDPNTFFGANFHTVFLQNKEIARVRRGKVEIYGMNLMKKKKKRELVEGVEKAPSKDGFEHFMLKELFEQPMTVQKALSGRFNGKIIFDELDFSPRFFQQISKIWIMACGTSSHAGLFASLLLEDLTGILTISEIASEARFRSVLGSSKTLGMVISQSGETADTLAALRQAQKKGCKVLGICNVENSAIARESDRALFLKAGPEVSVCSTKGFTSQLAVLSLVSLFLAQWKNTLSKEQVASFFADLEKIPSHIQQVLDQSAHIQQLAKKYAKHSDFFFMGRRYMYPTCLEAALKLTEISYVNANGYPAGELKHGPIALLDSNFPVIAFCANELTQDKILSNLMEVKARKAPVLAIAPKNLSAVYKIADDVIPVPSIRDELAPFASTVAGQLFAYYIAKERGCEIDQPRNLAKSVTVE